MIKYILLFMLFAFIDRMREIIQFKGWFDKSIFQKIKNQKLFKWIRSDDVDEVRYITLFGKTIQLHPFFWDFQHNLKQLFIIFIIILCGIEMDYSFINWMWHFILYGIIWFYVQTLTKTIFVRDKKDNV